EVVESFGKVASLIRCTIHTGRTHQIRVHLKSLGHVILGDEIYGWKVDSKSTLPPVGRVMLHAEHLVVTHPHTGKLLDVRAPLPDDFTALLNHLKPRPSVGRKVDRVKPTPKRKTASAIGEVDRVANLKKAAVKKKSVRSKKSAPPRSGGGA
ncbi:MAG TPA: hypothetical protein PLN52_17680, partial [Opitutaceae bacterium]|nr:hypothetical protein [Opitutaceae bacterium]